MRLNNRQKIPANVAKEGAAFMRRNLTNVLVAVKLKIFGQFGMNAVVVMEQVKAKTNQKNQNIFKTNSIDMNLKYHITFEPRKVF